MNIEGCPHPEEYSALLDRELAPEQIPTLERHVGECRMCRELFVRLSAADRMLALVLGKVELLAECMKARPGDGDAPSDQLIADIEAMGRAECVRSVKESQRLSVSRRRRLGLIVVLVLLAVGGGFAAAVLPSPILDMGGAGREGVYVVGPGEVSLHRGIRLKLAEGTRVRFFCAFRWERPRADLKAGSMDVLQGKLVVIDGNERLDVLPGSSVSLGTGGKPKVTKTKGTGSIEPPPPPPPPPLPPPAAPPAPPTPEPEPAPVPSPSPAPAPPAGS